MAEAELGPRLTSLFATRTTIPPLHQGQCLEGFMDSCSILSCVLSPCPLLLTTPSPLVHLTLATSQSPASVRLLQSSCHLLKIQTSLICHHHVGGGDALTLCQHPFWALAMGSSPGRAPRIYFLAVQYSYNPDHIDRDSPS